MEDTHNGFPRKGDGGYEHIYLVYAPSGVAFEGALTFLVSNMPSISIAAFVTSTETGERSLRKPKHCRQKGWLFPFFSCSPKLQQDGSFLDGEYNRCRALGGTAAKHVPRPRKHAG
ncbi:MAG: hypothetical protein R8G34_07640 [Paracoccaceae bacterium]|nr:hypothetical protein [Paracoccaceae bacterium]